MKRANIQGHRFGKLVVVRLSNKKHKIQNIRLWECVCDCGGVVYHLSNTLTAGKVKSCGCFVKEFRKLKGNQAAKNSVLRQYKSTAAHKGLLFTVPEPWFFDNIVLPCHYCGSEPANIAKPPRYRPDADEDRVFMYSGFDRVDNTVGYVQDNLVPCCFVCNSAKKALTETQFRDWIKRIYWNQFHKVSDKTPGVLLDELITTNMKLWYLQERLMSAKSDSDKATLGVETQLLNGKRNKLMRSIDTLLDFSDDSVSFKTYMNGRDHE
ncbi:MAG: hypothetical protein KOO63_04070 [Bacteroidales bacterium]|nr:hypothetical protein [Candidatus Latescibacterota bacterium]